MAAARQSAWTILDGKRINHALTKPGLLDYLASHSQIAFSLTCHGADAFTVKVGQPRGGTRYISVRGQAVEAMDECT